MATIKRPAFALAYIIVAGLLVCAQAQTPRMTTVNLTAESDKVRISAQGDVAEMRIDVANEAGDIVFESGAITGQQLDWNMRDTQGERVKPGTYLVTVTFRNAAGKLRKRVEQVTVAAEEEKSGTHVTTSAPVATPITGSGTTGTIAKFSGASTIADSVIVESAGKIGIGTAAPAAKLTVVGQIQTTGAGAGIKFPDGSVQTKAATAGLSEVSHNATLTGAGTAASPLGVAVPLNLTGAVSSDFALKVTNSGGAILGMSAYNNGVVGSTTYQLGSGVYGENLAGGYGVYGKSRKIGVYGTTTDTGGYGVYGTSQNIGVYGTSTGTASTALAGKFEGKVVITKQLTVDGSVVRTVVDGITPVTCPSGAPKPSTTIIHLPSNFEATHKDFRYQLTLISSSGVLVPLEVSKEIQNNQFEVQTEDCSRVHPKISWQVSAIPK
jgi:hypothetical protein